MTAGIKTGYRWIAVLVFAVSMLFYWSTLAPTVMWGDPGKLTNLAYLNYLRLHTANHPLHNLIGHYWGYLPFTDYSFGQNLLSAVFASLTVILLYSVVYHLTRSIFASAVASLSMAVSHTFWWLAVINESYSLAFFFFVLAILAEIIWLQTKKTRWLYLASFSLGMGISDHYILAVMAPAFIIATLIDTPRLILNFKIIGILFSFVMGAGLLVFIYFTQYPPLTLVYMVEPTDIETLSKVLREIIRFPFYIFFQFPVVGFILGIVGVWYTRKMKGSVFFLLLILFLIDYLFSAMYMWQRQPEMMVFGYIVFAIWIGVGAQESLNLLGSLKPNSRFIIANSIVFLILAIPLTTYYTAPGLAKMRGGNILGIRTLPYRDNDRYFLLPDKRNETGARRFAEEVFGKVLPNSIVVADFTPYTVLEYLQLVEKKRPDIKLIYPKPGPTNPIYNGLVEMNINKVPMYLVDIDDYMEQYGIEYLRLKYRFEKVGSIYRVLHKKQD